jgi:hypothetical protein
MNPTSVVQPEAGEQNLAFSRLSETFTSELLRDVISSLGMKSATPADVLKRKVAAVTDALAAFQSRDEVEAMQAAAQRRHGSIEAGDAPGSAARGRKPIETRCGPPVLDWI